MNDTANTTANGVETNDAEAKVALHQRIIANYDNKVQVKEVKFNFRTVKEVDSEGKPTGVETKRPTVQLALPVPSVEGLVAIFEKGGKELDLLLEATANIVLDRARDIVNENEEISQDNFPLDQVTWESIANMPVTTRRGAGIPKEVWEDFSADYVEVMPAVTGKSKEQQEKVAVILRAKLQPVKTNKKVLKVITERLDLYVNTSPNAEQYMECVKFLQQKADTFMKSGEEDLMNNL